MLAKISKLVKALGEFIKNNINNVILFIIVVLFILLSFASGYMIGEYQQREPIIIESSK